MFNRNANAQWFGNLKNGNGTVHLGSGLLKSSYSFVSRFENGEGTNPEELIAAAHASCYSMALSNELAKAGYNPKKVETNAIISLEMLDGVPTITKMKLEAVANVPNLEENEFQRIAETTKNACPVSRALNMQILLDAKLNQE